MGFSITRAACVLLLAVLSGAPALAAVCVGLCSSGQGHHRTEAVAVAHPGAHEARDAHAPTHHHDAPALIGHASEPGAADGPAPTSMGVAREIGTNECCPHGQTRVAAATPPRSEDGVASLAAVPVSSSPRHGAATAATAHASVDRAYPPPPPVRSPLVLRV